MQEALGKTAKQFFEGKLFSTNNTKLNLEIMNADQIGELRGSIHGMLRHHSAVNHRPVNQPVQVTRDAENWLKDNLDINIEDFDHEP